jgi:hypothetical protein
MMMAMMLTLASKLNYLMLEFGKSEVQLVVTESHPGKHA